MSDLAEPAHDDVVEPDADLEHSPRHEDGDLALTPRAAVVCAVVPARGRQLVACTRDDMSDLVYDQEWPMTTHRDVERYQQNERAKALPVMAQKKAQKFTSMPIHRCVHLNFSCCHSQIPEPSQAIMSTHPRSRRLSGREQCLLHLTLSKPSRESTQYGLKTRSVAHEGH